ncbi:MAG TPA: choice-of-anchor Q domain-containing protein [Rhodanobacteraceae bacterium]|nr:choice-of-anchor Q domain-containing protein [Rhodanobacteraceae bacterium]
MKTSRLALPLHPLAACLALVLGAPDAGAIPPHTAFVVQNCLDSGPGSLRQAIIDATPGDPIDLTELTCSHITLTSGSINVSRALLIQGPGSAALTIDGTRLDRVFTQTSTQVLALYGMTIQNGYSTSFGGGCVYSAGALQLNDTVVRNCRVSDIASTTTVKGGGVLVHDALVAIGSSIVDNEIYSALGVAIGGGAVAEGSVVLDHSRVSGNVASSASGNVTLVGGIDAGGTLAMTYSTVSNNRVSGLPATPGSIGGLRARAGATIALSTISGNRADGAKGGLYLYASTGAPNTIIDSTISGNSAGLGLGGLDAFGPTAILSSTIAFNVEAGASIGAGLRISYATVDLESTIIAANTSADGNTQNIGLGTAGAVAGANNLVGPSLLVTLPAGTIGGDPKLLPLNDNGGPTKTHALRAGSPAENAGNDVSTYTVDQRGTGYPRVIGPAADIGAFEGVDADSIFYNGFD